MRPTNRLSDQQMPTELALVPSPETDFQVKNPALPGGAFVNQEGIYLRFATSCHSSPLFRAGHPGRSSWKREIIRPSLINFP